MITIKILVVEPMRLPYEKEIDGGFKSMQQIVDGPIEAVFPFDEKVALVCNEEGKLREDLEANRALLDEAGKAYDYIFGTFFLVGFDSEDFISLTDEQVEGYAEFYSVF